MGCGLVSYSIMPPKQKTCVHSSAECSTLSFPSPNADIQITLTKAKSFGFIVDTSKPTVPGEFCVCVCVRVCVCVCVCVYVWCVYVCVL